jgi:hypothetical protein
MRVGILLALAAAMPLVPAQVPDIRTRLAAYEKQVTATGRTDPAALAAIATDVVIAERRSGVFGIWSEACGTRIVPDDGNCGPRLWTLVNRVSAPLATRVEAASALLSRGDKQAPEALYAILRRAPLTALTPFEPIIEMLPAPRAVAILGRLAGSPSETDQSAACKGLSRFDTQESRTAIGQILTKNAPASGPWLMCMIARARLHDAVPTTAVWGYGHTLQGDGQFFAAEVMIENDPDSATQLLTDLSRRGPMLGRLRAAELIAAADPAAAIPVIEAGEIDNDAAVRAAAVTAEQRLARAPGSVARGLLADAAPLVRIRAAENVIAWAERERSARNR